MNLDDQILKLYETGAPVSVIAQAMEMPEDAVQAALFTKSSTFRRSLTVGPNGEHKPVEDEMLDIIVDVARTSSNTLMKLSAAKYVRDDLKGRRDAVSPDAGLNTQAFLTVGDAMAQLHEKRLKFLAKRNNAIIDA